MLCSNECKYHSKTVAACREYFCILQASGDWNSVITWPVSRVSVNTTSAHRRPVFVVYHSCRLGMDRQCTHSLDIENGLLSFWALSWLRARMLWWVVVGWYTEAVGCGGVLVSNKLFLQQNTTASLLELYFNDSLQTVYARGGGGGSQQRERSPMGPMKYLHADTACVTSHMAIALFKTWHRPCSAPVMPNPVNCYFWHSVTIVRNHMRPISPSIGRAYSRLVSHPDISMKMTRFYALYCNNCQFSALTTNGYTLDMGEWTSYAPGRLTGVHTVEAVYRILVEYTAVSVETFTAGYVTPHSVKHYCTFKQRTNIRHLVGLSNATKTKIIRGPVKQ